MSQNAPIQSQNDRFELHLEAYANSTSMKKACLLIYGKEDKNLLSSLGSTPYVVGRSFPRDEVESLAHELKEAGVSFRFEGKPPLQERISFDYTKQEVEIAPIEKSMPIVPIASVLGALALVLLAYFILPLGSEVEEPGLINEEALSRSMGSAATSSATGATSKREAKAQETQKILQATGSDAILLGLKGNVSYRKSDSLFWDRAKNKMGLYENDSLRAFDSSQATIHYSEGSSVFVKPGTFIVIGDTSSESNKSQRRIDLNEGEIQARLDGSEKQKELLIKTEQGVIRVSSPKANEKSVQLETAVVGGKTRVSVIRGKASFEPKNKTLETMNIGSNQEIAATESLVSPPIKFQPRIDLVSPPKNSSIAFKPEGEYYEFRWSPLLGEGVTYQWTLASDEKMTNVIVTQNVPTSMVKLAYLDPGTLYWRVSASSDGIEFLSETYPINVLKRD